MSKVLIDSKVVKQALEFVEYHSKYWAGVGLHPQELVLVLRAALEQPVAGISASVLDGWKLVPVEPTQEMFAAACRDGADLNGRPVWKHTVDVQAAWRWGQMLAAAPQPPAVKQPQGEQEPVAWIENLVGALSYNPHHEAARKLPEGVRFDLYTRPHPRQPLTDEQKRDIARYYVISPEMVAAIYRDCISAIERAHKIGTANE